MSLNYYLPFSLPNLDASVLCIISRADDITMTRVTQYVFIFPGFSVVFSARTPKLDFWKEASFV